VRERVARLEELETEEPKLKTDEEEEVESRETLDELRPARAGRRLGSTVGSGKRMSSGLTP
jgi:hypothetical protein